MSNAPLFLRTIVMMF